MKLSFYDWCIQNKRNDLLERWDYDANHCCPKDVLYGSGKNMYFKCNQNKNHASEKHRISHITNMNINIDCKQCNSFYEWCKNNSRQDLIDVWDYNLNKDDIHYVPYGSGKKYYFHIEDNMPDILYKLCDITGYKKLSPIKKFYNSFGYWLVSTYGNDAIKKYWSDKNNKTPWDYDKGSGKRVWFKCTKRNYHDDYSLQIYNFVIGYRCTWCAGKKIHPLDSFAQYNINKFGDDFLEKYWCEDNTINPWSIRPFTNDLQIHIQCQHKDYHQYWVTASDYSTGIDCPFCASNRLHINDSLGVLFPYVIDLWSDKNTKSPYEYHPYSHQLAWWKCENGIHEDYTRKISDVTSHGFNRCSKCVKSEHESSYQREVRIFLESMPYKLLHEFDCSIIPINPNTKQKMPFDNEVCCVYGKNLIIETHGAQHYELNGWHIIRAKQRGITPEDEFEYQKWKDAFKKGYAISKGYEYLEIPYWAVNDNTYKNLILEKIENIKSQYYKNA